MGAHSKLPQDSARRPGGRRPRAGGNARALLIAAAVLIALLPLWWVLAKDHQNQEFRAEQSRTADLLTPYRDALVRAIEKRFALVDALRAFVHAHPDRRELRRNFENYASGLYSGTSGIRALELMPRGITEYVYPLAGNERIVGHDILRDPRPQVAVDVQRTLRTGQIVITDPLELWQGGTGMIARQAVFDGPEFWGFVTVVLDFPALLAEAGLSDAPRSIDLALRDRSGRLILGSENVFRRAPVSRGVQLADGDWTLAGVPAGGWQNAGFSDNHFAWFSLAIVGLISALVFLSAERQAHLSEAVREGDERYRVLSEAVPVVIAYVDREQRYRFSNQASQNWFDRAPGDPSGKALWDVLGAEAYDRVKPEIERALAGTQTSFELTAPAPDGATRYLKAVCIPRLSGGKDADGFYLLVTDVSDLKTAERAALESRDFLQRLLEDFPALVWRSGPDGECRYFNRSWLEFTGNRLEQECWEASVHPDDLPSRTEAFRVAFLERAPFQMEYRLRRHDGEYRTVLDVAKPFTDAQGRLEGYVGSCWDITERKRAEEALHRTNTTLEAVISASPLPIVMLDPQGCVVSWNPAATSVFGYPEEEVLGRPLPIVPEELVPEFVAQIARATEGEVLAGLERRRKRKDGSSVDVSIWTAPMNNEQGAVTGIMSMYIDITERKQLEEQVRQAQKMEAVGRLAGGVAHDFNNLLSIIAGYGHMLGMSLPPDDELRHDLQEILKAGERATDLTRQLLAFSRRQMLEPKVVDLNACIGGMEHMLRRLIGEDIELRILLEPALGRILADPGQIEQVVMNLTVNARDAMPRGGVLTIETANTELGRKATGEPGAANYVMLAVVDTGIGMDAETQSHVFEPFFTTKERGKGTGLGLSTVYGIVTQNGGEIRLYSQPGKGATFLICFPRVDAAATEQVEASQPAPPVGAETILLVEDERGVRELVREVLQRAGYTVLEASNAGEALLICEQHSGDIDLLLTDVVMPKMGGGELAKRLRPLRPAMRVLFMSGYMDDELVRHGVQNSGLAFIQKPLSPGTLVRKVREVLDAPEVLPIA